MIIFPEQHFNSGDVFQDVIVKGNLIPRVLHLPTPEGAREEIPLSPLGWGV